ncbi:hypothetical protein B7482_15875 [Escherichia coli]|nr:hypothetical protein [Escherichia coli]OSB86936.1 hypothetical protein B7482_15875 [Escherichia coli]TFX07580.1 hypothetical protein DEO14_00570 [Escherichia coli]
MSIPRTFSYPVVCFRFQNIMELFVFKCRDNDHKNDNMKTIRGVKGKKNGLPGEAATKCAWFYAGCGVNICGSAA